MTATIQAQDGALATPPPAKAKKPADPRYLALRNFAISALAAPTSSSFVWACPQSPQPPGAASPFAARCSCGAGRGNPASATGATVIAQSASV